MKRLNSVTTLCIFVSIILLLGAPYTKWGFKTDDFSNIYATKTLCSQGVKKVFSTGNIEALYAPSNSVAKQAPAQGLLSGLYRPFSFILYYPQYLLFGNNPYGYYLTTITIHAANCALFFLLMAQLFSWLAALIMSLLFAFHPSLANWLGWTSAQTYFSELLLMTLCGIFLFNAIKRKNIRWYIASLCCFFGALFTKETTIVVPFLLTAGALLYDKKLLRYTTGFWVIFFGYFATRAYVMGVNSNVSTFTQKPSLSGYLEKLSGRFFDAVTYVSDLCLLTWLPKNNQLLKGACIGGIALALCYLFYRSTQKKTILFLSFCLASFSWPILLIHYQARYIYLLLPLSLFIALLCWQSSRIHPEVKKILSRAGTALGILLVIHQAHYMKVILKDREYVFGATTQAFTQLLKHNEIKNNCKRPIAFVGLPNHWFPLANAQAIWLMSGRNDFPVYNFSFPIHLSWQRSYLDKPFRKDSPLSIATTPNGFSFFSSDVKTAHFGGNKELVQIDIPKKYRSKNPIFVTWDYRNGMFIILPV